MEEKIPRPIRITYRHYLDRFVNTWTTDQNKEEKWVLEKSQDPDDQPHVSFHLDKIEFRDKEPFAIGWGDISTSRLDRAYQRHAKGIHDENRSVKWKFIVWGYSFELPLETVYQWIKRNAISEKEERTLYSNNYPFNHYFGKALAYLMMAFPPETSNRFSDRWIWDDIPLSQEEKEVNPIVGLNESLNRFRFSASFADKGTLDFAKSDKVVFPDVNEFVASSPFKSRRTAIVFSSKAPIVVPDDYDDDLLEMVKERVISSAKFPSSIPSTQIDQIRIHNVGQGNFVLGIASHSGSSESEVQAVFDLGFTKDEAHSPYQTASSAISTLGNQGVAILSHWDLDHILGGIYAANGSKSIWGRTWIVPRIGKNNSQSAKNFALYLLTVNPNNVWFVENAPKIPSWGMKIGNIELSQGDARPKQGCTLENVRGIIAEVKGNIKKCLIPGDCIPVCYQKIYDNIDFLVVPHHGCDCSITNIDFSDEAEGFVCVGQNTYRHPNQMTINEIKTNGCKRIYRFTNASVVDSECTPIKRVFYSVNI